MLKKLLKIASVALLISVANLNTSFAQGEFITIWDMSIPGSFGDRITFPVATSGTAYYTWETYPTPTLTGTGNIMGSVFLANGIPGFQKIRLKIKPDYFQRIIINNSSDRNRLIAIEQWGNVAWTSMENAFNGCTSMAGTGALDAPNLSNVTNVSNMFRNASLFNQPIGHWNLSTVTNTSGMFAGATMFNQSISGWNVSNVADMSSMFFQASSFNQPIGNWNLGNATNLSNMFSEASSFNQPIGNWSVSKATNMLNMFNKASAFNQSISGWNVSNVTNMGNMFNLATSFNQPLSNWNISKVSNMSFMFNQARSFNQNLGAWGTKLNPSVTLQNFLNSTNVNSINYDAILNGFNNGTVTGLTMQAVGVTYCTAGASRSNLTKSIAQGGKGWDIIDDWWATVSIVNQPTSSSICPGGLNTFSVTGMGNNLSYAWGNSAGDIVSTSHLLVTSVPGNYLVTVTSSLCVSTVSSTASLSLSSNTDIVTQPLASASVCNGILQSFQVSATGENLSYSWSNNLSNSNSMTTSVSGLYFVTVSGLCGKVKSNAASLSVIPLTQIVSQPLSIATVCSGVAQSFTVSAVGANLGYLWNSGESVPSISTTAAGIYMVTVSGICGNATSNSFALVTTICGGDPSFTSSSIIFTNTTPSSFTGSTGDLNWPTLSGATTYCIRYSKTSNFSTTVVTVCGLNSANFLFVLSTAGLRTEAVQESIYYQVAGVDSYGFMSQWSKVMEFILNAGQVTYSDATNAIQSAELLIFPNPSSGDFAIKSSAADTFVISDVVGSIILQGKLINGVNQNVAIPSKGMYLVKVGNQTKKLILE